VLDASAFPASGPNVTTTDTYVDIRTAEGASADAVNGFEYMYALTITNNDNYLKTVSITASITGASGNWSMVYSDKDGGSIMPVAGANTFNVNGFGSTVIYVKVMSTDASDTSVPKINVTVTMLTPGQSLKSTSATSFGGTTVTFNGLEAQQAKMEMQDTSASGNNIFSEQSGVPILTLALIVLCIMLLITMVWFGMKKGVFVRRR
jgi:cobalamin biosynthesis Mg chelatase CobN